MIMSMGGGTFNLKNKALPGAYVNFVSAAKANATLSERGTVCMPMALDWGIEKEIFEVTGEDFFKNSLKIFGYEYNDEKLKGLYDLFLNCEKVLVYRNNGGTKAANVLAEAKYSGVRGNDIKIAVTDTEVVTYFGTVEVDRQPIDDVKNNDYVNFYEGVSLSKTAGIPLEGGENGKAELGDFFKIIESESFNILASTDISKNAAFINFTKHMRNDVGVKFQTVLYKATADYEGIISVENAVTDDNEASLVYWVAGALAGCQVNASVLNKVYDGSFKVSADYTVSELTTMIKEGKFLLHRVGTELRVLADINSSVSGAEDFKNNQVIRVIDQIGNDIAYIFKTQFLGQVPNDNAGRISLWNTIVSHHKQLLDVRAIEDFTSEDVIVEKGETKNSVVVTDYVTPVGAMAKLYMTVLVE